MTPGKPSPSPYALTPIKQRLVDAEVSILGSDTADRVDFLHTVLCQVGMPRKKTDSRAFERTSGNASMMLEVGRLWHRSSQWVDQPLPYGARPRLLMVHISSQAVKQKSPVVEVGSSIREFLLRLGINTGGGPRGDYTMFKKQISDVQRRGNSPHVAAFAEVARLRARALDRSTMVSQRGVQEWEIPG